jgi:phosphatidylserine/phosphatidylglycerophosphate/cardiolipin synthase-like enzyme
MTMSESTASSALGTLADIATALLDTGAVDAVCDALQKGRLTPTSTPVRHSAIAAGSGLVEARLRDLQAVWRTAPELGPNALAIALRAAAEALRAERQRAARTEVVWTGPRAETSYLRRTRQVVLDLVRGATSEILVVGYWIVSNLDPAGIVPQFVESVASAARRGARVKVVLDQAARPGGERNRDQFLALWPVDIKPPPLLTWHSPDNDAHLKLHAKVIVADRRDALVTSANLTMHAMDLNMEMGVRVLGAPASSIADHFDLLIAQGILVPDGVDT